MDLIHSKLNSDAMQELSGFFDLLSKYDFEDAKKHQIHQQEIKKDFSLDEGGSFLESCKKQGNKHSEEPSF